MKTYLLYLKSHTEAPDFEHYVEAKNHKEALKKIRQETEKTLEEWSDEDLLDNIGVLPNNTNLKTV